MADATYGPKVYKDSNGDRLNVVSGGTLNVESGATVNLPAASIEAADLGANLKTGSFCIPLSAFIEVASDLVQNIATNAGGRLGADTTPSLARVNAATDKALRLAWAAGNVDEITASFEYPTDLDDTAAVVVNLELAKDTNTDTAAVVAVNYFEGIGDSNAGTNTAALAASALAVKTVTIAASDVGAAPTFANISIIPGTHGTDAIYCYGVKVSYTRKT